MIYLVGGASRSGKSLLASRILARAGIPWFSLDALRMGLARGAPILGFDPEADDLVEAGRLWPIVHAIVDNLIADGRDYLIEGATLDPRDVARLVGTGRARACYLGYPRLTAVAKADLVMRHRGGPNDWLTDEPRDAVLDHLTVGCRTSVLIQRLCADEELRFFDTGADFDAALSQAEEWLLTASDSR